jgi:hypothetical protein
VRLHDLDARHRVGVYRAVGIGEDDLVAFVQLVDVAEDAVLARAMAADDDVAGITR